MRAAHVIMAAAIGLGGCTGTADPVGTAAEAQPSSAQEAAAPLIGMPEGEALQFARERGFAVRVGTIDDVGQPDEPGYVQDRLTLVVRGGSVAEVIVETESGPVVVAAS